LDSHWKSRFLGLMGFAVGLVLGVGYLIAVTRQKGATGRRGEPKAMPEQRSGDDELRRK
jgi:hypothetical protein